MIQQYSGEKLMFFLDTSDLLWHSEIEVCKIFF